MLFNKDRRLFLQTAAKLGLSAGALIIFEQACSNMVPTEEAVSLMPTSQPKLTPTLVPAQVIDSTSQTPVPYPTAGPTPMVGPTSQPEMAYPMNTPAVNKKVIDDPRVRMGHLLRRAGFGASKEEIDKHLSMGEAETISYLLDYDKSDDSEVESRIESLNLDLSDKLADLQRMAMLRMIYTNRPLQEKMVLFWHGLLTSGWKKVGKGPYMLQQDELFRSHAFGNYDDLLKAVARDSAMLIWLDSRVNKKNKPNENFARELMELFSMGVGTFTEEDVKESSRAFTGWSLKKKVFHFQENQHDFGVKTFLGNIGNYDGDDVVDIIMEQPVTSRFISRKLFEFFAYDNPEEEVIARLAKTFNDSGYSITALLKDILTSEEFYTQQAYRSKIKSPAELIAGTIRALGIESTVTYQVRKYMGPMGQELFNPFDVSGWPENEEWINSSTLLNRLNFVNAVAEGNRRHFDYDLVNMIDLKTVNETKDVIDHFVDILLDGEISEEEKGIYIAYLDGLLKGEDLQTGLTKDRLASLVYLVMSSPDYQLA
ncbi:MAG: hypothetical protein CL787_02380 [Chloroflexi bacterium]|nr:hypothetical protein [Chloroflexota bacterium]MQG00299.1 DUF1800 domain-containing protein [SAR202 cluster bacterium]